MFDSIEEAIKLGKQTKTRENDGGVPVFHKRAVAKRVGSEVEWVDEYWVQIFNKGDPKNIMEMAVREDHKERWPNEWQAFLNNEEPDIDGIPLDDFPKMTPAERERCKSLKLRSVEDLVNYPDGQIKDLGGRGHELQRAAKEFLEYKEGTVIQDLKAEIDELKRKLASGTNSVKDNTKRFFRGKSTETGDSDDSGSGPSGESGSDT